jgi:acyl-CoA synthetase (AMP-forming)/AMP-acid ligase II
MIVHSPDPDPTIPDVSLPVYVMQRFAEYGDRPAIVDGPSGRALTYAQLGDGVRRLAHGLHARGLRKGDVFAILLPNLPEYAIAFLGAAAAGATVTTLNPLMTADEIRHQLSDTGARWLVTFPMAAERAIEAARGTSLGQVFCLGDAPGTVAFGSLLAEDGPMPEVAIDPARDLLVLPYSSGTSGLPKGVMLSHRNLVAQLCQAESVYADSPEPRVIGVAPFFHILGLALVMLLWTRRGATVVSMARFELETFLDCIQRYRVRYATVVPPIAVALAKHPAVAKYDLSSLEWIGCGAAPLGEAIERACSDRLGRPVGQGWGMTELAGAGASRRLSGGESRGAPGSNGLLWPGMEARIVDIEAGSDLGPGEPGELWVRGPNVMLGYLNRADATAATLLEGGWLRTGDIARLEADGSLFIVDRLKELIKYNAYQIAPAELEAVLVSHPAVAEAAVVPSPDPDHGEVPKAFVVRRAPIEADELIAWVAERVAAYKKVRLVEFVPEIPKSPAGKLLRRVLVERERAASQARG